MKMFKILRYLSTEGSTLRRNHVACVKEKKFLILVKIIRKILSRAISVSVKMIEIG
jgi:hypothetical protein